MTRAASAGSVPNGGAVAQDGTRGAPDSPQSLRDRHFPGGRHMMAHELLRQAAQILGAGWSKGSDARDVTGRIVPLWAELLRQAALILTAISVPLGYFVRKLPAARTNAAWLAALQIAP